MPSKKALHRLKRCQYSSQSMRMAYDSVQSGQYTGRQAAAMFKVPYSTLNKKLTGRDPIDGQGAGRPLEICAEKEQKLADYLFVSARGGHGLSRREILVLTGEFIQEENINTRWMNGIPGFDWLRSFLKRHPEAMARKEMDPLDVYGFYQDLEHLYEGEKVTSNEAHRIYSLLEISLPCEKLSRNPDILQNDQLNASVFTCICADGEKLPPLVVFLGKCVTCEDKMDCNEALDKNCAERSLFCYWFENIFIPMLPRSEKSTILFFEGQSLQINMRLLQLAKRNCVFFVKLPPQLANHFQPLDLKCSSALKSTYHKHLQIWNLKNLHNIEDIQREKFGNVIGTTWKKSAKKNVITKGFERTGLFPLNKSKFDDNVLPEPSLKKFKKEKDPELVKSINDTIGDLKSGSNDFELSEDSHDAHTPKITHVTSVASKDVTSRQHSISSSSKDSLSNHFPDLVPNGSSESNANSKFEEKEMSCKEKSIPLTDECCLNEPELTIKKILKDVAEELIAEVAEFSIDSRRSERIFKMDASSGAKFSSIRKTI